MMVIQELTLEPVEFSTIVQCRHHWICLLYTSDAADE